MKSAFKFNFSFLTMCILTCVITLAQYSCDAPAKGQDYLVNIDKKGVILEGHDPVAFFTENKPVKGNPSLTSTFHEATYWFSNEANKKTFDANPAKFEPQYGAYCGYAVSLGHLAPIDVNYFSIIDGRLILQHNQKALNGWNENTHSLELADKYWPQLLGKKGKPIVPDEEKKYLVNTDKAGFIAEGYDVVAYFTENKAVKGKSEFVKLYKGAFYAFKSEENKQLFGSNPDKYMPQYGGYCAYAVSRDKLRPINPMFYQFVDGRLMLQHSKNALDLFSEDIPGNTVKADQYWPMLVERKAGKIAAGQFDDAVK